MQHFWYQHLWYQRDWIVTLLAILLIEDVLCFNHTHCLFLWIWLVSFVLSVQYRTVEPNWILWQQKHFPFEKAYCASSETVIFHIHTIKTKLKPALLVKNWIFCWYCGMDQGAEGVPAERWRHPWIIRAADVWWYHMKRCVDRAHKQCVRAGKPCSPALLMKKQVRPVTAEKYVVICACACELCHLLVWRWNIFTVLRIILLLSPHNAKT